MKKQILSLVLLLFLFSCNSDNLDFSTEKKEIAQIESVGFKVSPEEAIERLNYFINDGQSRTSQKINIQNIEALTKAKCKTRSFTTDTPDTLMYVVNLTDNKGFALMSADKRTAPIFALVEKGSYSFEDGNMGNPGFELFMEMAKNYIIDTTTKTNVISRANISSDWILVEENGPKLAHEWGQDSPFNMYTPIVNGKQAPVGCAAVAIGMSTAYLLKGNTFDINGYSMRFTGDYYTKNDLLINTDAAQNVARFLREIGRNINMQYGPNSSGATASDTEKFLKNESKIKYVTGFKNYGDDTTVRFLYDCLRLNTGGGIVLMGGHNAGGVGHMWLLDGIKTYLGKSEYLDLYHCNWGLNGTGNGWYLQTIYTYNDVIISGGPTNDSPAKYPVNLIYCCLSWKKIY